MASKFDEYAELCHTWGNDRSYHHTITTAKAIQIVTDNHYPSNLKQYAANEILLRTVALEYGVTP